MRLELRGVAGRIQIVGITNTLSAPKSSRAWFLSHASCRTNIARDIPAAESLSPYIVKTTSGRVSPASFMKSRTEASIEHPECARFSATTEPFPAARASSFASIFPYSPVAVTESPRKRRRHSFPPSSFSAARGSSRRSVAASTDGGGANARNLTGRGTPGKDRACNPSPTGSTEARPPVTNAFPDDVVVAPVRASVNSTEYADSPSGRPDISAVSSVNRYGSATETDVFCAAKDESAKANVTVANSFFISVYLPFRF